MKDFVLSCSSTADLDYKTYEEFGISTIPMHYLLAGKEFADDGGKTISYKDFYQAMRDGASTKTTQINVERYEEYFSEIAASGKDILHVELSSGLSGSVGSAKIAADEVMKKYPEIKIKIVDSLGASAGYGLLMVTLSKLKAAGKTVDEVAAFAEEHNLNVHHWFFSTDLTYYVRGGRVSKASGWFGTLLRICPLLNMSYDGKLIPRYKVVGKKNVIKKIVDKMVENADGGVDYDGDCFISHSDSEDDAAAVKALVEEKFEALRGKVRVFDIGTTIGSHSGPGTVALFFFGKKRED